MVFKYRLLINFFVCLFVIFFVGKLFSNPISMRFNKYIVVNKSVLSSKGYDFSKNLERSITKNININGDYSKNKLVVGIKRYNIKIIKKKDKFSEIFSEEQKHYTHTFEGFLEIFDADDIQIFFKEFSISSSKKFNITEFSDKKKMNDEVYEKLDKKLIPELRKLFLTNLGDFINPN